MSMKWLISGFREIWFYSTRMKTDPRERSNSVDMCYGLILRRNCPLTVGTLSEKITWGLNYRQKQKLGLDK